MPRKFDQDAKDRVVRLVEDRIRECLMVCVWEPNPHKEMNQNDYYGGECLMVCVWEPNPHKEMNQNDCYGETRSG